jgi:hypothetical protein
VRCACGNPLAEPQSAVKAEFTGTAWKTFKKTSLVTVQRSAQTLDKVALVSVPVKDAPPPPTAFAAITPGEVEPQPAPETKLPEGATLQLVDGPDPIPPVSDSSPDTESTGPSDNGSPGEGTQSESPNLNIVEGPDIPTDPGQDLPDPNQKPTDAEQGTTTANPGEEVSGPDEDLVSTDGNQTGTSDNSTSTDPEDTGDNPTSTGQEATGDGSTGTDEGSTGEGSTDEGSTGTDEGSTGAGEEGGGVIEEVPAEPSLPIITELPQIPLPELPPLIGESG